MNKTKKTSNPSISTASRPVMDFIGAQGERGALICCPVGKIKINHRTCTFFKVTEECTGKTMIAVTGLGRHQVSKIDIVQNPEVLPPMELQPSKKSLNLAEQHFAHHSTPKPINEKTRSMRGILSIVSSTEKRRRSQEDHADTPLFAVVPSV